MYRIGISGLPRSVPFMQQSFPGLEEREYRISQGHDAAAVLVQDGQVLVGAAEERFTGVVHTGAFPAHAIRYCLKELGIGIGDVSEIVHGFNYSRFAKVLGQSSYGASFYNTVLSWQAMVQEIQREFAEFAPERFFQIDHHLAHAASAYYATEWSSCLTIVVDAQGEHSSATIYDCNQGNIEEIGRLPALDSIGILYSLVTYHLGFDFNADEYKIMGLAPYGDRNRFKSFFEDAIQLLPDGGLRIPLLGLNRTPEDRARHLKSREYLEDHLAPSRRPEGEIDDLHRDIAAALQFRLEEALFHLCSHWRNRTGARRLALAGGVALNCSFIGRLAASGLFEEVFLGTASGDDGTALGAALCGGASETFSRLPNAMPTPFLGPRSSAAEIESAIGLHCARIDARNLGGLAAACEEAARRIARGEVIAWCRGRMEFGARALGNRSILADPRHPDMRNRINRAVKKREAFRPFAPSVMREEAAKWFDIAPDVDWPYMTATARIRPIFADHFPAVTHVDGTARVQTVSRDFNPDFYALLEQTRAQIGCGMLLNTSFNVRRQPIVATACQAIETFLNTQIDALFVEDWVITRTTSSKTSAPVDNRRRLISKSVANERTEPRHMTPAGPDLPHCPPR